MSDPVQPPWTLTGAARPIWERHTERLSNEGRLSQIDLDGLAVYSETLALYLELRADIDAFGSVVDGRQAGRVKHPGLAPLAACRDSLLKQSKLLGLHAPAVTGGAQSLDEFLASLGLEN